MKVGNFLQNFLPPAVSTVGNLLGGLLERRSERKQYKEMLDYNSPKSQMARYAEAGLSPYLIYSQGNSGNASSPAPAEYVPNVGKGIEDYMSYANFSEDLKSRRLNNAIAAKNLQLLDDKEVSIERSNTIKTLEQNKRALELLSDYPDFSWNEWQKKGGSYDEKMVSGGFRRKINELRMSASKAAIDRVQAMIEGMSSENVIKRVRAGYASDYGMVGGDWTQGLGLLKSAPSFFKSKSTMNASEKAMLKSYRDFKGQQHKRDANRFLFENLTH